METQIYTINGKEQERNGPWLQTFSGGRFWPLDPRVEDIRIEDITWSLAKICRYGGHTKFFYSVGQHCVLGSRVVQDRTQDPKQALAFLLHDASEAYLLDMLRPLKRLPDFQFYKFLERSCMGVIGEKFSVTFDYPIIKEVDNQLLFTERRDLMVNCWEWEHEVAPLNETILPWTWQEAGDRFTQQFADLTNV